MSTILAKNKIMSSSHAFLGKGVGLGRYLTRNCMPTMNWSYGRIYDQFHDPALRHILTCHEWLFVTCDKGYESNDIKNAWPLREDGVQRCGAIVTTHHIT